MRNQVSRKQAGEVLKQCCDVERIPYRKGGPAAEPLVVVSLPPTHLTQSIAVTHKTYFKEWHGG
jgi:hypothetical protein